MGLADMSLWIDSSFVDLGYEKSNIHGEGLFTYETIRRGNRICSTHQFLDDGKIEKLPFGNFNHSDNPNCELKKQDNYYIMFSVRDIEIGEELTVDYTKQPDLEQLPEIEGTKK